MSRPGTPGDGRPITPSSETTDSRPNTPSNNHGHHHKHHKKRSGTVTGIVFRQDALEREIEDDELEELTEAFKLFDHDGDGTMNKEELGTVMRSLGQKISPEELEKVFESTDRDNSGCICLDEFIHLMAKFLPPTISTEQELKEAFGFFDKAGGGSISYDELEQTVHQLGFDITPAQIKTMLSCADSDRDGLVTFDDFKAMWSKDEEEHHALMGFPSPSKRNLADVVKIHED